MLKNREKRAFWLFIIWLLMLPLMKHSNLAAQDDNFILDDAAPAADQTASGDQPLPDEGPVLETDPAPAPAEGETPVPEGEAAPAEGGDPAAMPALSADPNELLAKINGLSKAGKHQEVITELQDFEDAVVELPDLLAIYVEALIKSDKPDWNTVNRMGKALSGKGAHASLADYAQGLYWQNAKKPDLGKAITFFGKARSAKKPYADAAMAYYMAMVKKYWMILLAVVALPIVAVVKKKKKTPVVEINLDGPDLLADNPPAAKSEAELPVDKKGDESPAKPVSPLPADPASPSAAAEPAAEGEAGAGAPKKVVKVVKKVKTVVKPKEPETAAPPAPVQSAQPRPAVPTEPARPSTPYQPSGAGYETITSKHQAEIERIRELTRPERRPSVQADPELDALWGNLSRKAMQGRIGPQYRKGDALSYGRGYSGGDGSMKSAPGDAPEPELNTSDVSIDLSEEALRDDLVGKLKMLAITEAELREMFAQKNPAHIPHLIEYVLTRPEPVRLSFVAREIGHYGDPAVIDTLASLLYHEDHRVALAAIQGLENSKKPAAVLHLCPFLKSDVPLLAQAARSALANFGAVKILQALKGLSEHPDAKIREAGIFVLSRMKGTAVEDLLKKLLHDDSLEIRSKAILAMSYQKNPAYIDALREFFRIASDTDKALARKAIVYLQGFSSRQK